MFICYVCLINLKSYAGFRNNSPKLLQQQVNISKQRISLTTEPKWISLKVQLLIGPGMIFTYSKEGYVRPPQEESMTPGPPPYKFKTISSLSLLKLELNASQ